MRLSVWDSSPQSTLHQNTASPLLASTFTTACLHDSYGWYWHGQLASFSELLQDKTLRLEQMLSERDAKVEQLSAQLKSASANHPQASAANQESTGRDSGPNEEEGRAQHPSSAFDGMSDLKLEFQGQIMKLQQYIEANNLRHVDPLGRQLCFSLASPKGDSRAAFGYRAPNMTANTFLFLFPVKCMSGLHESAVADGGWHGFEKLNV